MEKTRVEELEAELEKAKAFRQRVEAFYKRVGNYVDENGLIDQHLVLIPLSKILDENYK